MLTLLHLRALFDAALGYMEENRPNEATLALFDEFWSYVAQQAAAGRVVFVTAGEVAEAAFDQRRQ